ncbi:MAG: NIPSNAP family protein [Acidimicrobiia bacterium]|nr:NIPSNAP family protein [Acidimicrobiia bacterium]
MKQSLTRGSAAVAIFLAGIWVGKISSADAAGRSRVFEIRTYTANEGKLDALHARFRNHTTRLFEKHGMTNVGYWKPLDEPLSKNTLIYLLAYPNREAAKKAWEEFRKDPVWLKAKQESEVNGALTAKVDSVYLEATDYSNLR